MYRTLYFKLLDWKTNPNRKPLILEGARQVGKTYLLQEFGRQEFLHLAYINCHNNPQVAQLFTDFNMDRVVRAISAICECPIEEGKTLVVLDEIQEIEGGLASLKYFCEQKRNLHIVVAGSLLGISYQRGESYPVGKVNTLRLYPMHFVEFLGALGRHQLAELVEKCDWTALAPLHNDLNDLLRQYYYVGGMPEAVLNYCQSGDLQKVRVIQKSILQDYERDFAKHAAEDLQRIRMVWQSIPSQLAKENKKFIFGAVRKGARAADFDKALQWLQDAALTIRIQRCKLPEIPLSFYTDMDAFKIYLLDIGLLTAKADIPASQILLNDNIFSSYKGGFTENYVLTQLLVSQSQTPCYYTKENSTMEIDFLLQQDNCVVPIEVKAEDNVKAKAFRQFITIDQARNHLKGIRISMLPYIDQDWMENIPLWSVYSYFRK